MEFGFELFVPHRSMSAAAAGSAGTVDSQTREAPIPSMGLVYKDRGALTYGFTALGIGGFSVDYPAVSTAACPNCNPLSVPQSAGGFGAIYANYQLLQMTPSVAYRIAPNWSIGAGLNIDWSSLAVNPFPAYQRNASGYPNAEQTATAWGWGFTVGTTYKPAKNIELGFSIKSPQWFQNYRWNSVYPDGTPTPTPVQFRLDYPMILGGGLSYKPIPQWMLAADLRWINYSKTKGFGDSGFDSTGRVKGFGWKDIWTIGLGTQYQVTPRLALRAGYNYGQNPISAEQQFFNVFAPAIVRHHASVGAGYQLMSDMVLNADYYHAFAATESGPLPAGYPSGTVTNTLSEDSAALQMQFKF